MTNLQYRGDVDGMRALAVLLVMFFHAGLGFTGGFIGVDVFFVISGFLITRLILGELDSGTFTVTRFWTRRIGRILPAVTCMVMVTLAVSFFILLPADYVDLANSALAQQAMAANVFFWRDTGYFAGPADLKPLLHTWSLGVEEQFYVGYPLLLVSLHGFGRKILGGVLALLAVGSFALSVYGTQTAPSATFFLLPTRAWELLLGSLMAFAPGGARSGSWFREVASWVALASIGGASWLYDSSTPFPGLAALIPCAAAATLIHCNTGVVTAAGRLLAATPLVSIGVASYSLYLWHWPVLSLMRYWCPSRLPLGYALVALALSAVLAAASWRYVEEPFRAAARRASAATCFIGALVAVGAVCAFGFGVRWMAGFPGRLPATARAFLAERQVSLALTHGVEQWESGDFASIGGPPPGHAPLDLVVWGDSHAMAIADVLDSLASESGVHGVVAATPAVIPIPDVYNHFSSKADQLRRGEAVMQFIRDRHVGNVLLVAKWQNYEKTNDVFALHDAAPTAAAALSGRELMLTRLEQLCRRLGEHGIRVWIMARVPHQQREPRKRLAAAAWLGTALPSGISATESLQQDQATNDGLARIADMCPNVRFVDPSSHCFDADGLSRIGNAAGSFYHDCGHLTPLGAEVLLRPILAPIFESVRE